MRRTILLVLTVALAACSREQAPPAQPAVRPSILLVTLDTTRADSIGPEAAGVDTPAFNAVAEKGRRFRWAYAPVPQTLPSHASMMTGLYPAGHGIHENARYLAASQPLVAERLKEAGYSTAAFVSAYPLARDFGLARGFGVYDDALPAGMPERSARETTDLAISWLQQTSGPVFLWVHYFEPHDPYEPPEPYRSRYGDDPYRGEIAAMDEQLGRMIAAFEQRFDAPAILIAGDHGESLGEHGEAHHGNLVYQGAMHVPLVIAGPDIEPSVVDEPVSIRRIFHTILDLAGIESDGSLRAPAPEIILGEAMQPYLQYGWQPQVMAVEGTTKVIRSRGIEVYDVAADPGERNDLGSGAELSRAMRQTIREYPVPALTRPAAETLDDEGRKQLASLGYVTSEAAPVVRPDAPRPADMAHLFEDLERASALFVRNEYRAAIPVLEKILAEDPSNLSAALRLAAAHSALGENAKALEAFRRAETIAPDSDDVRHFLAMHYLQTPEWEKAGPLLERVLASSPNRLPAIEGLATVRVRQGRLEEALALRQRLAQMKAPTAPEWLEMGELAMALGRTDVATRAFESARALQGAAFEHDLELGVLYLASGRTTEARDALDRVPAEHPGRPMALFKRAQISVLLNEPDREERIAQAKAEADETTRELIARERLFRR